jgi:membrane fusion protein (multidrug efflux system)
LIYFVQVAIMSKEKAFMQRHRRLLLIGVPLFFLLVIVIYYLLGGRYVSTDDAYVQAAKAAISSNVPGQVSTIYVHDNQVVQKGDKLFSLDAQPFQIAVENAHAKLVSARLQVQSLKATYHQQLANVQAAQDTLIYQQQEFQRQKKLATSGISSQMQLNHATNSFNNAKQQLAAAQQQLANILASLSNNANIAVDEHPLVEQAQAQLNKATLNLSYTTIIAPMDGIVTKVEQLQKGDYINTGAPVFSLISNKDIWIEANFKETQITYMRPGQKATAEIDAYPNKEFTGHVVSTSPGTGSSFSLLPPENATGNWVKIVQRVPVRISIDTNKDSALLGAGLSVSVTVDTQHRRLAL